MAKWAQQRSKSRSIQKIVLNINLLLNYASIIMIKTFVLCDSHVASSPHSKLFLPTHVFHTFYVRRNDNQKIFNNWCNYIESFISYPHYNWLSSYILYTEGSLPRMIIDKTVPIKQLNVVEAYGLLIFRADKGMSTGLKCYTGNGRMSPVYNVMNTLRCSIILYHVYMYIN